MQVNGSYVGPPEVGQIQTGDIFRNRTTVGEGQKQNEEMNNLGVDGVLPVVIVEHTSENLLEDHLAKIQQCQ